MPVNVLISNVKPRVDRRKHIICEFKNKKEFIKRINISDISEKGTLDLWEKIKKSIIKYRKEEYIIICEDDHQFTNYYSFALLQQCIKEAQDLDADTLSGGVSWFKTGVQISKNLFLVEKFSGLQFTIIFKKFYNTILVADFKNYDQADYKISELTDKKFVIHPFMSIQKDFGYSDITKRNNDERRVERLFEESSGRFDLLRKIKDFYSQKQISNACVRDSDVEQISLPLYTILREKKIGCSTNDFFSQKNISIESEGVFDKWEALCHCINDAESNEDDFICISFSQIKLAHFYDKFEFLNNIVKASQLGCELLLGNVEMFNHAVPLTDHLFWIDSFLSSSLMILFAPVYKKILSAPPDPHETDIYSYLSYITSHKITVYPFVVEMNKSIRVKAGGFQELGEQLSLYQSIYKKYLRNYNIP